MLEPGDELVSCALTVTIEESSSVGNVSAQPSHTHHSSSPLNINDVINYGIEAASALSDAKKESSHQLSLEEMQRWRLFQLQEEEASEVAVRTEHGAFEFAGLSVPQSAERPAEYHLSVPFVTTFQVRPVCAMHTLSSHPISATEFMLSL